METLRILWYNWRCIRHPLAGGAEVYTHEVARRLARMGHEIVLATSRPPGLPREEEIDGYHVIREGGKYTVYLKAPKVYRELREKGWRPDVVIDEVNTIPFLTPHYAQEPISMLIHQLCQDCWRYALHSLAQPLGWALERRLHQTYIKAARTGRLKAIITVSPSTRQDLIQLGYPPNLIHIAPNGLDWDQYKDCAQQANHKQDLAAYIGRITPYKRLEDLIKAWKIVEQQLPHAKLVIAGRADPKYLKKLKKQAQKHNLKNLTIKTNITQQEKKHILAKAKTLVYTSTREGWGQTILEAAACKTPTIAYNVPGLKDAIKHMETGILVQQGNITKLTYSITLILHDNIFRTFLSNEAFIEAKNHDWKKTYNIIEKVITNV